VALDPHRRPRHRARQRYDSTSTRQRHASLCPSPPPELCVPRMPHARNAVGSRPHRTLDGDTTHSPAGHGAAVSPPPRGATPPRLGLPDRSRPTHHLDHTNSPYPHQTRTAGALNARPFRTRRSFGARPPRRTTQAWAGLGVRGATLRRSGHTNMTRSSRWITSPPTIDECCPAASRTAPAFMRTKPLAIVLPPGPRTATA